MKKEPKKKKSRLYSYLDIPPLSSFEPMMLRLFGLLTIFFGLGKSTAFANGQNTHIWISLHALEHLPTGELHDLLSAPENREALINGSIFPDGGYAFGEPYGEASHWEGFQNHYMSYFRNTYAQPWDAEARMRVAFMMGMSSHGMADQLFDAMYMERAKQVYDANANWSISMDEATDVVFAALTNPQPVVPVWFPSEFPERFEEIGVETSSTKLSQGQTALGIAVTYLGNRSQDPDAVQTYELQFPWATTHLMTDVPGAPPCEGEIVAKYWEHLWRRLHGDDELNLGPLASVPDDDYYGHPLSAANIDSMVSVIMPRGLASVTEGDFTVLKPDGQEHPIQEPWLFYRNGSHVVNLIPTQDWTADTEYTIVIRSGLQTFDGLTLGGPWTMTFHTFSEPKESGSDPVGCGCRHHSAMGLGLASVFGILIIAWRRQSFT